MLARSIIFDDSVGDWDCQKEDYNFIRNYIDSNAYTDYDELLQLCEFTLVFIGD
jgi:hypothetical protein